MRKVLLLRSTKLIVVSIVAYKPNYNANVVSLNN